MRHEAAGACLLLCAWKGLQNRREKIGAGDEHAKENSKTQVRNFFKQKLKNKTKPNVHYLLLLLSITFRILSCGPSPHTTRTAHRTLAEPKKTYFSSFFEKRSARGHELPFLISRFWEGATEQT